MDYLSILAIFTTNQHPNHSNSIRSTIHFVYKQQTIHSIIGSPRQHLLGVGLQNKRVFPLRHIASSMIRQRQIVPHHALLHQTSQRSLIHLLLSLVSVHRERPSIGPHQPSRAERQRSERLPNMRQQRLRLLRAQHRVLLRHQREMRALAVLDDHSLSGRREGLDSVDLALQHSLVAFLYASIRFLAAHRESAAPTSPHGSCPAPPCARSGSEPGESGTCGRGSSLRARRSLPR